MWIKVFGTIVICLYFAFNILTAKLYTAKQMRSEFIIGQCLVGKICANLFYAPAWFFKGVKAVVLALIA